MSNSLFHILKKIYKGVIKTSERFQKLYIISFHDYRETILESLQSQGVVQIEDVGIGDKDQRSPQIPTDLDSRHVRILHSREALLLPERRTLEKLHNDILGAISFLRQYIPERSGWDLLRHGPDSVTRETHDRILSEFDYDRCIHELRDMESQIKKLHARGLTLENRKDNLVPWKGLDMPLSHFCRTEHVIIRALCVPATSLEACRKAAQKAIEELWTAKLSETKVNKYIIIMYHKDSHDIADKIMQDFDVHPVVLPCEDKTPSQMIQDIDREMAEISSETVQLENRLKGMKEPLLHLKVIANHVDNILERKRVKERCGETLSTFIVKGWIPANKAAGLEEKLHAIDPDADIALFDPQEGEDVPIIMNNPAMTRPFESVIDIFGKPNYWELDPTPFVAPFFFIGFGYCLADAGYGLLMVLLLAWVLWKLKLAPGTRKFCKMLLLSGISGAIIGVLTGGWFGNLLSSPEFPSSKLGLASLVAKLQIIDPLGRHVMIFLGGSFVIGFIQIFLGVFLKFWGQVVRGRLADAFLDPFFRLLFYIGLIPGLLYPTGLVSNKGLIIKGLLLSGIGLILLVIFFLRSEKNILVRIGSGFLETYFFVAGFVSDFLSYCRLFALGLTSGIMAGVTNIICFLVWRNIPYAGWILGFVLLVVFHGFNLILNIVSAFIHMARLQFVEFFPKFYESGGRAFEPFVLKQTYVTVEDGTIKS